MLRRRTPLHAKVTDWRAAASGQKPLAAVRAWWYDAFNMWHGPQPFWPLCSCPALRTSLFRHLSSCMSLRTSPSCGLSLFWPLFSDPSFLGPFSLFVVVIHSWTQLQILFVKYHLVYVFLLFFPSSLIFFPFFSQFFELFQSICLPSVWVSILMPNSRAIQVEPGD